MEKVAEGQVDVFSFVKMKVEGGSHQILSEVDFENNAASTTPTRTPPRKWSLTEVK